MGDKEYKEWRSAIGPTRGDRSRWPKHGRGRGGKEEEREHGPIGAGETWIALRVGVGATLQRRKRGGHGNCDASPPRKICGEIRPNHFRNVQRSGDGSSATSSGPDRKTMKKLR